MVRLFRVFIPSTVLGLLLSEVLLVSACYYLACALMVEGDLTIFLLYEGGLPRLALVVASIILGLYFNDLYTALRVHSRILLLQQMSLVIGITFLIQGLLAYLNPAWRMPRRVMLLGSLVCFVVLPAWRILYNGLISRVFGAERLLLVGNTPLMLRIARHIETHPELNFICLGFLTEPGTEPEGVPPEWRLGELADLREVAEKLRPSRIVVGTAERRLALPIDALLELRMRGIRAQEAEDLYEATFGRVSIDLLRPSQLVFSNTFGPDPRNLLLQSVYSTLMALVLAAVTAPVMLVVAVLIKLTSRGPVLYRQTRMGLNNRLFTLYKFRSMRVDAEAETGAVWATENDPRVTGLGRWLRRLRLDELPQLFNVLNGEMSMVGPRPERPEFVETLAEQIRFYRHRHAVKPGITGWAQISYKYGNTLEDTVVKLEYDLYYVKHFSPALDFYIMFHTAKIMLLTRGSA
jgi:sugar transferase (PEP-CTERM system associated)